MNLFGERQITRKSAGFSSLVLEYQKRTGNKMTEENRKILDRINAYANEVMGDIDPQKVQVSVQLDKLRPIMETIAAEKNMSLEDFFIMYMDLQSEASCLTDKKMREELQDLNDGNGMPLLYR